MTKEERIKAAEVAYTDKKSSPYLFRTSEVIYLQRQAFIKGAEAEAESKWVSVEDRLPAVGQRVMFVVDSTKDHYNGKVYGGVFTSDKYFSVPGIAFQATFWQPSPQPPLNQK